jgi:hypothetical protein
MGRLFKGSVSLNIEDYVSVYKTKSYFLWNHLWFLNFFNAVVPEIFINVFCNCAY